MKRLVLASIAIVALGAGQVYAGDCARFAGLSVGANGGWASQQSTWNDPDNWVDNFSFDFNTSSVSRTRSGVTLGAEAGYTWQTHCTVFGVSVDGNWADIGDSKTFSPAPGGTKLTLSDNLNWYGTLQTRAGIVVDNLMLYATGGVALANIKHGWSISDPFVPSESFSADSLRFGGVGGIGTELAWGDHWTIKSETLYFIFDEEKTTGFSPAAIKT